MDAYANENANTFEKKYGEEAYVNKNTNTIQKKYGENEYVNENTNVFSKKTLDRVHNELSCKGELGINNEKTVKAKTRPLGHGFARWRELEKPAPMYSKAPSASHV
ncbi:hypothetical protein [Bacillus alkalicellulosilyticus]|uniref:hypothetical protein n=1 Tax=Alkalihalobacterium alkalicellulosilyticum TaxID=1912214 RepID=UPI0009986D36|nr:hypothetical protein [Bacillus alkalicellulosilyticus]